MIEQLTQQSPEAVLQSRWKYLWSGWGIALASGLALVVSTNLLSIMVADIVVVSAFVALTVAGVLLFAALVISISSLLKKNGGLTLLLTNVLGSATGVSIGSFLFYLLSVALSGNTH